MPSRTLAPQETRSCYGTPGDWCKLGGRFSGRQTRSERHARVEACDRGAWLRVRCHDCGAIAIEHYRKHQMIFDRYGRVVRGERDALAWALERLDTLACQPLAAVAAG